MDDSAVGRLFNDTGSTSEVMCTTWDEMGWLRTLNWKDGLRKA